MFKKSYLSPPFRVLGRSGFSAVLCFVVSAAGADGLSTSFVDIMVPDVKAGTTHEVLLKNGHRMELMNSGTAALQVTIDVLPPSGTDLGKGVTALPSASWIQIQPQSLRIEPHETVSCRVFINVPADRRYRNRLYEASIWTRGRAADAEGLTFSAGLKSRLRFRTQ
jgi:hypothetical protein